MDAAPQSLSELLAAVQEAHQPSRALGPAPDPARPRPDRETRVRKLVSKSLRSGSTQPADARAHYFPRQRRHRCRSTRRHHQCGQHREHLRASPTHLRTRMWKATSPTSTSRSSSAPSSREGVRRSKTSTATSTAPCTATGRGRSARSSKSSVSISPPALPVAMRI
ncbi:hypothetical protein L1887_57952 [Cichorium endivia]|nr:hypothetical protein L1887_57952 [Cichorium endivia]